MNQRRNECDRGVFLRGLLFSAVSRTLLLAASVIEGPKYLVADILIDVSSRSPQVRIGRQLSCLTLGAVLIRCGEIWKALRRIRSGCSKSKRLAPLHKHARTRRACAHSSRRDAWSRRRLALVPKLAGPPTATDKFKLAGSADVRGLEPPPPEHHLSRRLQA
jgi:hypothetical protein